MPCCRKGNCGSPVNLEILGDAHLLVLKTTRFLVVLLVPPFFVLLVFGDVFIKVLHNSHRPITRKNTCPH